VYVAHNLSLKTTGSSPGAWLTSQDISDIVFGPVLFLR
jgi:hypothetical protein